VYVAAAMDADGIMRHPLIGKQEQTPMFSSTPSRQKRLDECRAFAGKHAPPFRQGKEEYDR